MIREEVGADSRGGSEAAQGREPRLRIVRLLSLMVVCVSLACNSEGFLPSRPAELSGGSPPVATPKVSGGASASTTTTSSALPVSALPIVLIGAPSSSDDAEVLKSKARTIAGIENVRMQIIVTGDKGSPESQAELVRKAAGGSLQALIVEPGDPADLALIRAVEEARDHGQTVVLMGRPLATGKGDGKGAPASAGATKSPSASAGRIITTVPEAFPPSARQLVAAAINNAGNIGYAVEGGAVLAYTSGADRLVEDRAEALRAALKSAGVKDIKELPLVGEHKEIKATVTELMKAKPKVGMVLAADQAALRAAYAAMSDVGEDRSYVLAGYSSDDSSANMARGGEFAAAAVYSSERLLRKTIMAATAFGRGQTVPDLYELMVPVHLSPKTAGAPKLFKMYNSPGAPNNSSGSASQKQ